jgi:hypothetical protein
LKASPAQARALLLRYVVNANQLAAKPEVYNSRTANCTTTVAKISETTSGTPSPDQISMPSQSGLKEAPN